MMHHAALPSDAIAYKMSRPHKAGANGKLKSCQVVLIVESRGIGWCYCNCIKRQMMINRLMMHNLFGIISRLFRA